MAASPGAELTDEDLLTMFEGLHLAVDIDPPVPVITILPPDPPVPCAAPCISSPHPCRWSEHRCPWL